MTAHLEVLNAALPLPDAQRAELAHRLLVSLDGPTDDAALVEAEWNAEIAGRVARIETGATRGIPADEVRRQFGR